MTSQQQEGEKEKKEILLPHNLGCSSPRIPNIRQIKKMTHHFGKTFPNLSVFLLLVLLLVRRVGSVGRFNNKIVAFDKRSKKRK